MDAFGRARVSNPYTTMDTKCIYDAQPYMWDDAQTSGSGTTSTYNANQASVTLAVSNATAGTRVRQTLQRPNYQPGKSQLVMMTGVYGAAVSGVTKRWGVFDGSNGLFFELSEGVVKVVRRTSFSGTPQDYPISQASWSVDTLTATNTSGVRLDTTKSNIYYICFEWLGVGDVEFGIMVDAKMYPCHRIKNANRGAGVYMSTPNLPLRIEISNSGTGAAANVTAICGTIISEGGVTPSGYIRAIDRATTPLVAREDGNTFVALAMRVNPQFSGATIFPTDIFLLSDSASVYHWELVKNPVFSGTAMTFANTDSVQSNIPGNTTYASGGIVVMSGYSVGSSTTGPGNSGKSSTEGAINSVHVPPSMSIGTYINGNSEVYAMTYKSTKSTGGGISNVYCSIGYNGVV